MILQIEINATKAGIEQAASVLANMYNGRLCQRKVDSDNKRKPTSIEDEMFEGLALATAIVREVRQKAKNAF